MKVMKAKAKVMNNLNITKSKTKKKGKPVKKRGNPIFYYNKKGIQQYRLKNLTSQKPILKKAKRKMEEQMLKERQLQRKEIVDMNRSFIDGLCKKLPDRKNPKGITYRRRLQSALRVGAEKVFNSDDEEYLFVKKISRELFNDDTDYYPSMRTSGFSDIELSTLGKIAEVFGAFNY